MVQSDYVEGDVLGEIGLGLPEDSVLEGPHERGHKVLLGAAFRGLEFLKVCQPLFDVGE